MLILGIQYYGEQANAKHHSNPLAKVGKALRNMFGDNSTTNEANAKKKSDKQKLREENQRLQEQINEMKQIKSQNIILPNGSSVAFSQLPPDLQRAMLNNTSILLKNVDTSQNATLDQIKKFRSHINDDRDIDSNNPLAKVGEKLKRMFR